ncbi:MAG: hypothetical protein HY881_15730 [Deltaproteobacteria bacterium]|nr:hypothetical protein [Deltaproteobacteria bacterium]
MKTLSRDFAVRILMILATVFYSADSVADDALLDTTAFSKQYLVQLSGTVMNETFSGAQALLTLMTPAPGSSNPYQLIVEGFPKKNSRNSFFWNAEYSEMTGFANEITCDIKRTFVKPVPMHFIFMSPALLNVRDVLQEKDKEQEIAAEKVALPTLINARAGKLKLHIYSNSVSGTVWMKGYDPVEHAFVQYSARLYGRRSYNLKSKQEIKK